MIGSTIIDGLRLTTKAEYYQPQMVELGSNVGLFKKVMGPGILNWLSLIGLRFCEALARLKDSPTPTHVGFTLRHQIYSFHKEEKVAHVFANICEQMISTHRWALIKDEQVYNRMTDYTTINTFGVSHESQLRALKLLKVVLQGGGRDMFQLGYTTLSDRWRKLSAGLSLSRRFSLQKIAPQHCSYFQRIREPSPSKFYQMFNIFYAYVAM